MATVIDGSASVTINSGAVLGITSGTAVASTSGTSVNFTDIPSWVKRVTVMFSGVSTNGSSPLLLQIGSGSVQTTGYVSSATNLSSAVATNVGTNGFILVQGIAAATTKSGAVTLTLMGSQVWTCTGALSNATADIVMSVNSGIAQALGGALDRIRITTVLGTDTFDAGSINIMYEG